MKPIASLLLLPGLLLSACQPEPTAPDRPAPPVPDATTATGRAKALALTLDLPAHTFRTGQTFQARIVASNTTDIPINIHARTAAPFYLHVYAHDGGSWQRVETYPQAAAMVLSDWTLPAGQERTFTPTLRVEPSWPTGKLLRLEAVLNGRDDVNPFVTIEVLPNE
jgi:hypothetical protein